jgi:hypothetical protein
MGAEGMSLIAYAGKPPEKRRSNLAYRHFQLGRDTAAIATMLRVTEATILKWITTERSIRRSLPIPYQGVAHAGVRVSSNGTGHSTANGGNDR